MMSASRFMSRLTESSLFTFLALVAGFLFMYTYGRKYLRQVQLSARIPGPSMFTLLKASVTTIKAEPVDFFKMLKQFQSGRDDIMKIWLGSKLMIFLYHPDDVEIILNSTVHLEKSAQYSLFKPWFGNGLLISSGPTWKHHRKMIAPTFHQAVLKNFIPTFYENSLKVVDKMKKEIGKSFDCHDYMSAATVDILLETTMGYKEPRSEETGFNYAMAVMKMCSILHKRHFNIWLGVEQMFKKTKMALEQNQLLKTIKNLTTNVVRFKKVEYFNKIKRDEMIEIPPIKPIIEETEMVQLEKPEDIAGYNYGTMLRDDLDEDDGIGEKKRLAFLDQLTANAQNSEVDFTEQDVLDQVNTIMFEGHDTTAAGSSFALCLLGIHKNIQNKVIEEIDEIFHGSNRPATFNDTLEMKYLERVIMETLRLYPPVPAIARVVKEEVKLRSGNYTLPIGANVSIAQYFLHRRPDCFPNPDVFNPDNFLPEKCQERHHYSYIPFSAGPRSCVGRKYAMLQLKVLLSTILRHYYIHSDITEKDFNLQADIILKINKGFNISLKPRTVKG